MPNFQKKQSLNLSEEKKNLYVGLYALGVMLQDCSHPFWPKNLGLFFNDFVSMCIRDSKNGMMPFITHKVTVSIGLTHTLELKEISRIVKKDFLLPCSQI